MRGVRLYEPGLIYYVRPPYSDRGAWTYSNTYFCSKNPSIIEHIPHNTACILLDNITYSNTKISRILVENGIAYVYSRHLFECKK